MNTIKFTIISDTHGDHEKLGIMSGDVLIHCGDMFNLYNRSDVDFEKIDDWFGRQNFDLILCIDGKHDFDLEERSKHLANPFKNAVVLNGDSYTYKGVNFFGAPWVPDLDGHAYFVSNSDLKSKWAEIPNNTDVLITHTPPAGIMDKSSSGLKFGCPYLSTALDSLSPRLHCFGHVHASSGVLRKNDTMYINASMVNRKHKIIHKPYKFTYGANKNLKSILSSLFLRDKNAGS